MQSGHAGILGKQTERYAVRATLDGGRWRDVTWTVQQDDDPEQPLWDEGGWPFPLGGDHTRDAADGGTPVVARQGEEWTYTWTKDGMQYTLALGPDGGPVIRQAFRLPGKVSGPDGWAKGIAWDLSQDAQGWPRQERLSLRVGKGLFGVDLDYVLQFRPDGDCAG
jgi:hypothetical protein